MPYAFKLLDKGFEAGNLNGVLMGYENAPKAGCYQPAATATAVTRTREQAAGSIERGKVGKGI